MAYSKYRKFMNILVLKAYEFFKQLNKYGL